MEPPANLDVSALRLAERLVHLLDRGGFTATYKYAVLIALIDLCMERTTATGLPPDTLTTRQIAEKVIELYWLHCAPYDERGVLHQSTAGPSKQALIVRHILDFRNTVDPAHEKSLPLSRARSRAPHGGYESLVREVEWTLIHMPLPRLQAIDRDEDRFLYEYHFDLDTPRGEVERYQRDAPGSTFNNVLELRPGVGAALIALNGILRPMIFRAWTTMVASMNNIQLSQLEDFLFGSKRISLDPVRPSLYELQNRSCFYCEQSMSSICEVDHFLPWSRHADNSIENLVAAHRACNGKKSDFLAAAGHVERWRARAARHAADLARIAHEQKWESRPERAVGVARAIYRMLPDDARLWRAGAEFVPIERERSRIVAALAA
jgi:HNH endonuclease